MFLRRLYESLPPQDGSSPNEDGETEPEGEWDESESWAARGAVCNGEAKPHRGSQPPRTAAQRRHGRPQGKDHGTEVVEFIMIKTIGTVYSSGW